MPLVPFDGQADESPEPLTSRNLRHNTTSRAAQRSAVPKDLQVPGYPNKTGSSFKLSNDGRVTIADKAGSTLLLNADGTTLLNSNLIVNGYIDATGDIIDNTGTNANTMASFRRLYDAHVHRDTYSGNTTPPLAPDIL